MAPLTIPANFDRVARVYEGLERLAFGRELERARFCFLDQLRDCRSILLLGEGDGRSLARVAEMAPEAQIHCLDASAAMLARAAARVPSKVAARITFEQADVLATAVPPGRHDAVATFFFLDCFTPQEVATIVARVRAGLTADARWLFADFVQPPDGLARWRARAWLAVLYAFFRWETGIGARRLPPSDAILRQHGFRCTDERTFGRGIVRSVVYRTRSLR